jgi:hypothetical protein
MSRVVAVVHLLSQQQWSGQRIWKLNTRMVQNGRQLLALSAVKKQRVEGLQFSNTLNYT